MKSRTQILIAVLSLSCATMAYANAPTITFGPLVPCPSGYCPGTNVADHIITFENALGHGSPYSDGIATYTFTAASPFVQGTLASHYAAPPFDDTVYLSAGSPDKANPVTITFTKPISYFGFYLGSPDTYNTIDFYQGGTGGTLVHHFTGGDLIAPGNGDQSVGGYMNFNVHGGKIDTIVMSSAQAAFETDNHAYAVPEPGFYSIAAIGMSGLWFAFRRRRA